MAPKEEKTDQKESKNNISAPSISLPKGGGAIRGIGEKFAANPVTGTGAMTVPIAISPGRSGFGPQLSLSYDSGAGNGPFGFGWSLSLPSITRKTDKRLPKYQDAEESDVFILSGAEDLVPVFLKDDEGNFKQDHGNFIFDEVSRGGYAIRKYRPRIEGLFARIERWTNNADPTDVFWRSISKDNITTWYGKTEYSRIFEPSDHSHIFSWIICQSYDDKGNAIVYEYAKEDSNRIFEDQQGQAVAFVRERNRDDQSRSANRYIKRIKYGNTQSRLVQPDLTNLKWLFEIVFDYEEGHYKEDLPDSKNQILIDASLNGNKVWPPRQDPFSSYKAGFEVRTYRLCRRVLMFHHFNELKVDNYLVRSTEFTYLESPVASFITGITQSGYVLSNGLQYLKKSLPPLEFEYSQATINEEVEEIDPESLQNLPIGIDGSKYQLVDLDGEGISGILTEQADAWYYKPNLGNGSFGQMNVVASNPSLASLGSGRQQLLDLAGDGQLDLADFHGPTPGFYERTTDEQWENFKVFESLPNIVWDDPNLRFVDLNGDGHADILITENEALRWYPSLAESGFDSQCVVSSPLDEEDGPRLVFADGTQSIYLADMSGDGLTDLARIRNGEVCYWPNVGYGRFGKKVTMDNSPWFDSVDQFDQKRIRVADIDGSGNTDIIYLHADRISLYFNQSGNGWSREQLIRQFSLVDNLSSVMTADILGDGTACLVWSSPLPNYANQQMKYIRLMKEGKPHLLISVVNNLGAETIVQYAPSTKFYLQDKLNGTPWITRLPFPVHCVEKTTVIDKWRKSIFTTTYSYHHGYFDGIEREFRGFGRVEQVDVETLDKFTQANINSPYISNDNTLYQPPVKTVTWYHTGMFLDRQRILSHYSEEYFPNWFEAQRPDETNVLGNFHENDLPEPDLEGADLTAEEWREALRACKGMMLRQEVYELDVKALESGKEVPVKLFTTAFHNCDIKVLQPIAINRHAVFHVTENEALTYHYELDLRQSTVAPDPRIAHTMNLNIDEYGNIRQSIAVVYPRIGDYKDNMLTDDQNALINRVQKELHLSYTENIYTCDIDEQDEYRLRLLCETTVYEVTGISSKNGFYFSCDEFLNYWLSARYQTKVPELIEVREINYHEIPDRTKPQKRPVDQTRTLYFDKNLKDPLPFEKVNSLGIPHETYRLALTDELLAAIFDNKLTTEVNDRLADSQVCGYLNGTAAQSRFGNSNKPGQYWIPSGIAGYADDATQHFFLPEKYFDPFGNITSIQYDADYDLYLKSSTDPLGNTVSVERFDFRVLAPQEIKDINNNISEIYFDVLGMPAAMALKGKGNEGDNLDAFDDALANPDMDSLNTFFTGSYDETKARTLLGGATLRYVYYFGEKIEADGSISYEAHPSCACGLLREKHVAQLVTGEQSPLQTTFEYSDGMGTVLVKKVQAEPDQGSSDLRWITSGKTILNNKGKPVKQYEPYFSTNGQRFEDPVETGVTPIMYYDAVGRLIRTDLPDGSYSRVDFSPWYVTSYDANDTVLEDNNARYAEMTSANATSEEKRAARLTTIHADTPAETILDSLGREVITLAHNKFIDKNNNLINEKYLTYTKLDTEGKPLWICDARNNLVMQYVMPQIPGDSMHIEHRWFDEYDKDHNKKYTPCYDIANNLLFQHSMDAGDRWILNDAAGKPMYAWEFNQLLNDNGTAVDENRLFNTEYDDLHRPLGQRLTINDNGNPQLIEKFIYGEQVPNGEAPKNNLRGKLWQHYDQSGLKTNTSYDFKSNPLEVHRRLAGKYNADVIGWQDGSKTSDLELEDFVQITEYDALNRMSRLFNWHHGTGSTVAVYEPTYSRRGLLEREELVVKAVKKIIDENYVKGYKEDGGTQRITPIKAISYNAKGQREKVVYGNSTITRYKYDDKTFRLTQLRTTRFIYDKPFPNSTNSLKDERVLQNLYYTYDPVGNITEIYDDAYEPAFFKNQQVDPQCQYTYDAIYRLIIATGRENYKATAAPGQIEDDPFTVQFPVNDQNALRKYTQIYVYDSAGNISQVQHSADNGAWTRNYEYDANSNRLSKTYLRNDSIHAIQYQHDDLGNMLNLANVDPKYYIHWDYRDMIHSINKEGGGWSYYNYDSGKQRTRKVIETQNGTKQRERIYLGGLEIYRRYTGGSPVEVIETIHLMEGDRRLLLVEDIQQTDNKNLAPGIHYRYQYNNHLGSAVLELDDQGSIISYEEYHPYGTTAYRAVNKDIQAVAKRYRYTGKERDEESGLYYYGARYYASWLGRWCSCDPIGIKDGINIYCFVKGSPVIITDPNGKETEKGNLLTHIGEFSKGVLKGQADTISNVAKGVAENVKGAYQEYTNHPYAYSALTPFVGFGVAAAKSQVEKISSNVSVAYQKNGVTGILEAANAAANPVYQTVEAGYEAFDAFQTGEYEKAGFMTHKTVVHTLETAAIVSPLKAKVYAKTSEGLMANAVKTEAEFSAAIKQVTNAEIDSAINTLGPIPDEPLASQTPCSPPATQQSVSIQPSVQTAPTSVGAAAISAEQAAADKAFALENLIIGQQNFNFQKYGIWENEGHQYGLLYPLSYSWLDVIRPPKELYELTPVGDKIVLHKSR